MRTLFFLTFFSLVVFRDICSSNLYTEYAFAKLRPFVGYNSPWTQLAQQGIRDCRPMNFKNPSTREFRAAQVCLRAYEEMLLQMELQKIDISPSPAEKKTAADVISTVQKALSFYKPASDCTNSQMFREGQNQMVESFTQALKEAPEKSELQEILRDILYSDYI